MASQLFIKKPAERTFGKPAQNIERQRNFCKQNSYITVKNKQIYYNEILLPEEFEKIYAAEKIVITLEKEIKTNTTRPFFNIPSAICTRINLKPDKIIILRLSHLAKTYELIAKIHPWGKINIPTEVIATLNLTHNQKITIEVITEAEPGTPLNINLESLFKNQEKVKIIHRENEYITIYSLGKTPITLPNSMPLHPELIEHFFLIHGDGHYQKKLFFSNKEAELHQSVIKTFEKYLKIPRFAWKMRINLHDSYNEELAREYWLNALNFNAQQLYPSISRTKFNTSPQGDLRICLDYPIVSNLFRSIFYEIQQNLDETSSFHALNGLLAAEGGAQIEKKGLHRITLSYNKKEKEMFKLILRNCGVLHLFKDQERKNNHGIFVLEKWDRLYPFFKEYTLKHITLFNIHSNRKKRAIRGMIGHSFTNTMCKYLSILNQTEECTIQEFSQKLKIREDSCLDTLRKEQYKQFINIKGLGINRHPFTISITKQGKELLEVISALKSEKDMNKQLFVKKESKGEFGKNPTERTPKELIQYGIVNIDKPAGPTEI